MHCCGPLCSGWSGSTAVGGKTVSSGAWNGTSGRSRSWNRLVMSVCLSKSFRMSQRAGSDTHFFHRMNQIEERLAPDSAFHFRMNRQDMDSPSASPERIASLAPSIPVSSRYGDRKEFSIRSAASWIKGFFALVQLIGSKPRSRAKDSTRSSISQAGAPKAVGFPRQLFKSIDTTFEPIVNPGLRVRSQAHPASADDPTHETAPRGLPLTICRTNRGKKRAIRGDRRSVPYRAVRKP